MEPILFAYIIGFTLSILTLLPVTYGIFIDGITTPLKKSFFILLVVNIFWTITQLLQVYVSRIIPLLGIELATTILLCLSTYMTYIFTVTYTENEWLLEDKWIGLSAIPFFIFGINLVYKRLEYVATLEREPFHHFVYPLTSIDLAFIFFVLVIYIIIYSLLLKSYYEEKIKYKSIPLFAFGLLTPVSFGFISYYPSIPLPQINHAPLGFPVLAISMAIAVFGLDMLDIEPIALEHFAEELPDPIFIFNDEKEIINCNKAAKTIFSENCEETALFEQYDLNIFKETITRDNFEYNLKNTDSENDKIFSITSSPVRYNESLIGWVVHMKDITELENQKRELERQNEQLQRFSDGVTHELRNPLTVASQYTELYFDGEKNDEKIIEPEKAQEKISNAHTRIDEIIESVEWLSKYGQTITETEPVSVREAATEVWHSLDKDSNAELSIETDVEIMANKTRLKTAFDNLFKNSLRYASPNPKIKIWAKDGELYIEDNGPGISSEDIEDIFEYGYTTSEEGTGFGLPVVKTIIESHGWEITVDTSYENGARFVISNIKKTKTGQRLNY